MIPKELINEAQWCGWKYMERNGQRTKVPIDLHNYQPAKSNDASTFAPYAFVEEAQYTGDVDGFGIRIDNGFCAIDIDHCIEDNELSDLATDICNIMQCYTELSPSKKGLRIICKANIPEFDRKKYYIKNPHNGVEIYATGITNRFVTITGNTLHSFPVREATAEIYKVFDKYMLKDAPKSKKLTDEEIIEKASKHDNFRKLFEGDMSAHNNDHSAADLALCNMLAFWTGKDALQMDSIFRKSALYRPDKWNRDDYRKWTIDKAIDGCTDTYSQEVPMDIWTKLDVRSPLNMGEWHMDTKNGVYYYAPPKKKGELPTVQPICTNPVVPAAYLKNALTGQQRVELHYIDDGKQESLVCDMDVIYNKSKVVSLSNSGIHVTSNHASMFVEYMSDMKRLNPNVIPRYISTSSMGWQGETTPGKPGFMPYDDTLVFDGESENYTLYNSITQQGDYDAWLNHIAPLRHQSLPIRLMMAASFASPLIEVCGVLPFVFHLWGTTGTGKSVALKVASSIWGNPGSGKFMRTMDMTNASMCSTAAFLNSLPFAGDELQTIKKMDMNYDKLIMQITEGIERGRMHYNKNLPTRSWRCAFLFTGEEPCTNDSSGGGTKNRVFELEYNEKIVSDGHETSNIVDVNYGHAGVEFINYVAANKDHIRQLYSDYLKQIIASTDATDKQAMVGAIILVGDAIACEAIFHDAPLTIDAVSPFLKTNAEVLTSERAYDMLIGWIAKNAGRFNEDNSRYGGEVWGKENSKTNGQTMFILEDTLKRALQDMNFSFDAVKKPWADKGLLIKHRGGYKNRQRINGKLTPVVEIKLPEEDFEPTLSEW